MAQRVPLLEVVKKIHALQRDLDYTRKLQERMVDKQSRFPMIFNGITRQIEFLQRKLDELKELDIDVAQTGLFETVHDDGEREREAQALAAPPHPAPTPLPAPVRAAEAKPARGDVGEPGRASPMAGGGEPEEASELDLDIAEEEHGAEQATADVNAAESAVHAGQADEEPMPVPANHDRRSKFAALAARSRGRKLGQA